MLNLSFCQILEALEQGKRELMLEAHQSGAKERNSGKKRTIKGRRMCRMLMQRISNARDHSPIDLSNKHPWTLQAVGLCHDRLSHAQLKRIRFPC